MIEQALRELKAGKRAEALASLIRAWRTRPLPRLADAIEQLGGGIGPLFEAKSGNMKDKRARIAALVAKHGRDPRLARMLFDFVRDATFSSTSAQPVYNEALRGLAVIADPRVVRRAAEMDGLGSQKRAAFDRIVAKLGVPPEPTPAERAELELLEKSIGGGKSRPPLKPKSKSAQTEEALLAAIYDAPDDDAPRRVFADLLTERGDPRGEFITRQLDGKPAGKIDPAWIGPLAPELAKQELEFRRGFLSGCLCKARQPAKIANEPSWATVERLRFAASSIFFVEQSTMKSLRDITVVWDFQLEEVLDAKKPWRIERVRSNPELGLDEALPQLAKTDKLPELRALELRAPPRGWLAKTPFAKQLRELVIGFTDDGPKQIIAWLAEAAKLPALEKLELRATRARGTWPRWFFSKDAKGALSVATLEYSRGFDVVDDLKGLPAGSLTSLTVRYFKQGHVDPSTRAELEKAAKKHKLERIAFA
jgi:uncharacterized protein (TIGR02996 family)